MSDFVLSCLARVRAAREAKLAAQAAAPAAESEPPAAIVPAAGAGPVKPANCRQEDWDAMPQDVRLLVYRDWCYGLPDLDTVERRYAAVEAVNSKEVRRQHANSFGAIPTTYNGVQFRSRIEARWAAFFDLVGWRWDYEPIDLNGYIPDFVLQWYRPTLVEIKSAVTITALSEATKKIDVSGWEGEALVLGSVWHPELTGPHGRYGSMTGGDFIGLVKESEWSAESIEAGGEPWGWFEAGWSLCTECKKPGVLSEAGCYRCRVCGAYEGDHYVDGFWDDDARLIRLRRQWIEAGNAAQWRGLRARP